jgi:hypothetical protein
MAAVIQSENKKMIKYILYIMCIVHTVAYGGFLFSGERSLREHKRPLMDPVYEKSEALNLLNEIREAMGMNTLVENSRLEAAALAHSKYTVTNHTVSHDELHGLPGFTGKTPAERAIYAGYLSRQVTENLSAHNPDARRSIDGLFSAIYHRFGFLDVGIDEIGVGVWQDPTDSDKSAFVYLMGNTQLNALCAESSFKGYGRYVYGVCKEPHHRISQKKFLKAQKSNKWLNPKVLLYPYDGQSDVPPAFYNEIPDPLPDYDVSGFPLSVLFNDYFFDRIKLLSFKLYESDKEVLPVRLINHENDPNHRLTPLQFALLPLQRLKYDTVYDAAIIYMDKGIKRSLQWQFHTRRLDERLVRMKYDYIAIEVKPAESLLLYLVPRNAHDIPKRIIFPEGVTVSFTDNNTLRIQLLPTAKKSFDIKADDRNIHINIKN